MRDVRIHRIRRMEGTVKYLISRIKKVWPSSLLPSDNEVMSTNITTPTDPKLTIRETLMANRLKRLQTLIDLKAPEAILQQERESIALGFDHVTNLSKYGDIKVYSCEDHSEITEGSFLQVFICENCRTFILVRVLTKFPERAPSNVMLLELEVSF